MKHIGFQGQRRTPFLHVRLVMNHKCPFQIDEQIGRAFSKIPSWRRKCARILDSERGVHMNVKKLSNVLAYIVGKIQRRDDGILSANIQLILIVRLLFPIVLSRNQKVVLQVGASYGGHELDAHIVHPRLKHSFPIKSTGKGIQF